MCHPAGGWHIRRIYFACGCITRLPAASYVVIGV
jgi:hypothetical protein